LENVASCETDVQKSSRPTTARVANPSVFYAGRDYSFVGEGGAEMSYVRQVVCGLPETTMDNEEQGKRSFTIGKPKIRELTRISAVGDPQVERR
jgi:hypothetical protein